MARRINTKFVTILLMIITGSGAAIFIAQKFLIKEHPDRYIALGVDAMKDQKWTDAVANFTMASRLSPRDPAIQMKLAAAYAKMAQTDPQSIAQVGAAFSRAVEIDPNYLPALKALAQWYAEQAPRYTASDNANGSYYYRNAIDYSRRAHALDPGDAAMASLPDKLIVQKWIGGLETDQQEVDNAVKDLNAQWLKDPSNADLPFTIASASLEKGMRLAPQNASATQSQDVTDCYKQAAQIFERVLSGPNGGTQGGNAAMHYSFARVLEELSGMDRSSDAQRKQDADRATDELARARELAKPEDPSYFTINRYAAEMAMRRGDRAGALRILRSMPQSTDVELVLAPILGATSEGRADAEQGLRTAMASLNDDPMHLAFGGARYRLLLALVNLQVDDYMDPANASSRPKLHDQIQAVIAKLETSAVGDYLPLKEVEARFQINSGKEDEIAAIQSLSKLMANNTDAPKDYALEALLAQALYDQHEPSKALPILTSLVDRNPRDLRTRKFLVAVLLTEAPDRAAAELDKLESVDAGDPDLIRFHIEVLKSDPDKNKDQIEKYYGQLPEKTERELGEKAHIAFEIKDLDETVRLLNARIALNKDPADYTLLAKVLMFQGKKDQALETAQRGLAANPSDGELRILIPEIKGEDPKVIEDMEKEQAEKDPDRLQGALESAALAQQRGDNDDEEAHLKAAEKLAPQSAVVWDRLFQFYIKTSRFSEAEAYIPKLASVDYDSAGGELYRLSLAQARGDNADALDIATKLTQTRPEFAGTWLAMGDVLYNEGEYDEAVKQYELCLDRQSNQVRAYVGLVRCFYALHNPGYALDYINRGLSKMPNDATLRQLKLTHELNYGNPLDAVNELKDEINAQPDRSDLYAALGDVVLRYAAILRQENDPDGAVKQAQEDVHFLANAVKRWPDEPAIYIALEESQLAANDPNAALQTLQQWASQPHWHMKPDPYLSMADLFERVGRPDDAENEMRTAVARSNYRANLQIGMAAMYAKHGKYDEALGLLRAANTDKPAVRFKTVQILLMAGRFDEAQAELKSDLASHPPDSGQLLTLWSMALLEHGRFAEAADRATRALAENPKDQNALLCRAKATLRMPQPDPASALQDLKVVSQSSPHNSEVRLYMATADLMLNKMDDAATELQAGLRFDPANKPVRMKLVELYSSGEHPHFGEALQLLEDVDATSPFDKDPDIFQEEAILLDQMHHIDEALPKSEKALSLAPQNPAVVRTNLVLLLEAKDFQDVIDRTAVLSDKLKSVSWFLWERGIAEQGLNLPAALPDLKTALAAARKERDDTEFGQIAQTIADDFGEQEAIADVIPLTGSNVGPDLTLARLYEDSGDDARAISTVDSAMSRLGQLGTDDQARTLHTAAMLYQMAKPAPLVDKAYDAYQRWLRLDPNNVEALNNLACLLADDYTPTRAPEGLAYANQAVDLMTKSGRTEPVLLDTQAWLLILTGTPEQGVSLLNTTMSDYPPFADEYVHLSEGYLRMQLPLDSDKQAKRGIDFINSQPSRKQDSAARAKLQDLVNRSEAMMRSQKQAQVP